MPATSIKDLTPGIQKAGIDTRSAPMGSVVVAHETWPPGDYSPLFRGLPGDACGAEHWGYCIRGRFEIVLDGRVETVNAGDVYHFPPGHRFRVVETAEIVEFTPNHPKLEATAAAWKKNFPAWVESRLSHRG